MPISIVIAEDQRLFRQSLKFFLEQQPDIIVAGEAQDGQDAVMICKVSRPDIVLMDVAMPRMDGITATKLLQTVSPLSKVLMLSIHDDDERIQLALEAGAVGYILKDASGDEFIRIIKSIHNGEQFLSPYLANLARPSSVSVRGEHYFIDNYHFTEREVEVLRLLTEGHSNSTIADGLYLSDETVKMYLKNIFRKLEVKNRTEAAVLAVRHGLVT